MTDITTGGCLCGAVTFQITGPFEWFFLCHCSRCRKSTGSAHASNLFSTVANIEWMSGKDDLRIFRVDGTRFAKTFCTTCGSPLPTPAPDGSRLLVPAGSLDTEVEIRPNGHIFCASRANWDDTLEDVPAFDERPG